MHGLTDFLVVEDCTMKYDLLLDRQFFQNANLKLIHHNSSYKFENNKKTEKFIYTIFNIDIVEKRNIYDEVCENLDRDMPFTLETIVRSVQICS